MCCKGLLTSCNAWCVAPTAAQPHVKALVPSSKCLQHPANSAHIRTGTVLYTRTRAVVWAT
jgi:hypothetical protein